MKNETRMGARIVSCFVLKPEGGETKVLIMKRVGEPLDGEWHHVAGRLEEGETAWQAALRELEEEASLKPDRFYAAEICEQFYSHRADMIMVMPVFVAYVGEGAEVVLNEEHSQFKWMSLAEAKAVLPFPGQRRVLAQVWEDFVEHEPTELLRISV